MAVSILYELPRTHSLCCYTCRFLGILTQQSLDDELILFFQFPKGAPDGLPVRYRIITHPPETKT